MMPWTVLWAAAAVVMIVVCGLCGAAHILDGAALAATLALVCAWQAGASVGKE